ncbi:MAG TPA: protein kinase [Bryobacteraceae bacterium]|nr:protein kinase [Bryobacteraceae bacterium]
MADNVGDRIGDYQIVEVLGAGGMGKVYKVRNIISERVEAMKVLLPNLESDPELADRFMREIKVQASLDHPNIAGLHTAQRVGNQLIMIMEYVEGSTLESILHQGRLPIAQGVEYVRQVLSALSYAHARGIIHRDIKPANMMVTGDGAVKLMDFGIAKMAADRKLTQTGRTVGSLYYMSPEQINGAVDLDPRSDLYSLGVSLYEILTGTRPFLGDSDYSIMAAHLNSVPVPPIQIDPRLPAALNEIILMAISRDPAQRFQTADAFRAALGSVGQSGATGMPAGAAAIPSIGGQPAAAAAAAGASAPEPRKSSSRRGLYMAAGSVATIGVLVLAAIQGPKLFKSSSASQPQPPIAMPAAAQPEAQPQTPVSQTPAPVDTAVTAPAQEMKAQPQPPTSKPPVGRAGDSGPARLTAQAPVPQPAARQAAAQAPGQSQFQAAQPTAPIAQPQTVPQQPAVQSAAPAVDNAKVNALRDLRETLMMLGTRANALKGSLAVMKREQQRQGLNMRSDIVAREQQMEIHLDDAETSLKAGDPARMKKSLEAAERDVESIEKFLGR